jgi:nitroreductase
VAAVASFALIHGGGGSAWDWHLVALRRGELSTVPVMDAYLAIASKREVRKYDRRPLAEDAVRRILDAGRIAGSAANRQARRFVVLRRRSLVERASNAVYAPDNLLRAALVVVVVVRGKGPLAFDAGRAAQNMMLAAWNDGIGSCPNGVADRDLMREVLDLADDEQAAIVLSFGYPARPSDPERRPAHAWIERANRLPFDAVVEEH